MAPLFRRVHSVSVNLTGGLFSALSTFLISLLAVVLIPTFSAAQPAQNKDTRVPTYVDEPLKQLLKQAPELKQLRPAANEQDLLLILRETGLDVDQFFDDAVDLVAREEIHVERLGSFGVAASRPIRDNYLIVHEEQGNQRDFDEFRTDDNGRRIQMPSFGFLITSGFALICMHFSTGLQPESQFRYLGEEKFAGHDTYVVAFAQKPDKATTHITFASRDRAAEDLFVQGIAWIDETNFHILRLRTDLLAPRPDIGLDQQTTIVTFSEIHLADIAPPLWLPYDVDVYLKFGKSPDHPFPEAYRNVHRYSDYRRYRVSTRMLPPSQ